MPFRKKKEFINYVSDNPELEEWIRDFSKHLKTHPEKDTIIYPESFATGYARVLKIEDGLTFRMVNYRLNSNFVFERLPSPEFYLIIYYYQYSNCRRLDYRINDRVVLENVDSDYSSLLMTNSQIGQELKLTEGTIVRGLTIQISEAWLKKNLVVSSRLDLNMLRKKDVFQTFISIKSRRLLVEIFSPKIVSPVPDVYLSARVLQLLDYFLENIFQNGLDANVLPVSSKDVQQILNVQQYLIKNYREQFPTIEYLSRLALMSGSKLKQSFKKAFGMGLFEYFQKNRMMKARELLQSNLYTVTEVGNMLGYHNLSNFSTAFRKEFGYLPREESHMEQEY